MQFVFVALLIVYNIQFLLYCNNIFPVNRGHWLNYAIVVISNIACYIAVEYMNLPQTGVLAKSVLFMLGLKFLFEINLIPMLFYGLVYIFIIFSFKGIVASVFALILSEDIDYILQGEKFYTVVSIAALASILFIYIIKKTIVNELQLRKFHWNGSQMKNIVVLQIALLFYLMLIFDGRFVDSNPLWFTILYLVSNIWSLALMLVVWNKTIRAAYLQEYERQTKQLQEQLERQLRHYKSYQKYTESFRNFKHDYNTMMSWVKTLLKNNENDRASKLIDDIEYTMHNSVLVHKTYSNNFILDAILQDEANVCDEYHIRFSALALIPPHIALSKLDIIRIFSNALRNAIEACCRIEDYSDRFIEVSSFTNEGWLCIMIKNSFNGEIKMEDEGVVTIKQDKENHGVGIRILKEIVEKSGGLIHMDIDPIEKIFITKFHIPAQ
ncbi:sensor histidine kinase [Bacillus sp. FJAT-28004]|uniref:sensor histidine kinase n=1 Tax=Bacillus sp. FJAT-28004 TaxID=1679165 RepID=UPI0006B5D3BA|nr:GHKL domain-containing protein [Bacillus sp. FJAT-28004]